MIVLVFSVSVVDMALVLAPSTPAPLAVRILVWFRDPDLMRQFVAAVVRWPNGFGTDLLRYLGSCLCYLGAGYPSHLLVWLAAYDTSASGSCGRFWLLD